MLWQLSGLVSLLSSLLSAELALFLQKFSINNDTVRVVPQQQPLEPYCLLVREMPPTVNESSWLKLFEQSRCADGSACPLPTAARYEHFNNTWVIVFGSEEDVRNAHAAARWLSVDGVQLRARLRIDGKNPYHVPMQQQQHHQQQQQHQQPYMPHPAGFVPPFAAGYGNPGYPMGAPMMPPYGFNPMANGMRPMFPMDMMGAPPPYMMAPPPMVPPFYPYMGEQQFAPPAGSYPYVFAGGQYQRNPNGNGNGRMNRGPGMGSGAGGYGNPYARPYNNNYSRSPVSSQGGQQGRYPRGNYQDGSYQEHDGDRRGERRSNTSADHYRPTAPGLSDPMDGEEADRLPVEGMSLQADDDTQPETQVEVQHPQPEHHHHLAEEASDVPSGLNGESVEEAVSPDAIASVPETGDSTEPRSGERRAKGPRSGSDGQEDGKRDRRRSGDDRKPRASGSGGDAKGTSSSRGSGRRDRSDSTRGERGGRDRKDRDKEKAGDEEEAKKERVPKGPAITLSMEVDFPVLGDSKSSPHPKAATIGEICSVHSFLLSSLFL